MHPCMVVVPSTPSGTRAFPGTQPRSGAACSEPWQGRHRHHDPCHAHGTLRRARPRFLDVKRSPVPQFTAAADEATTSSDALGDIDIVSLDSRRGAAGLASALERQGRHRTASVTMDWMLLFGNEHKRNGMHPSRCTPNLSDNPVVVPESRSGHCAQRQRAEPGRLR
jgi:hypothetical protein